MTWMLPFQMRTAARRVHLCIEEVSGGPDSRSQLPGGFDSQINPGEFVLTSVVVDFRRNAALTTTTTSAAGITSAAGVTLVARG